MSKIKVGDIVTPVKSHGALVKGRLYMVKRSYTLDQEYLDVRFGGEIISGFFSSRFKLVKTHEEDDLYI